MLSPKRNNHSWGIVPIRQPSAVMCHLYWFYTYGGYVISRFNTKAMRLHLSPLLVLHIWRVCHFSITNHSHASSARFELSTSGETFCSGFGPLDKLAES